MKMTGHFVADTVEVMCLVEVTKGVAGLSCFSSHIINRCPTQCHISAFLCYWLVISVF